MILNIVILALVTLERAWRAVAVAAATRAGCSPRARAKYAPGHYPLIVALHAAWLAALWWLAPGRPVDRFWLALFVLLELGAHLGARYARAALDDADHRPSRRAAGPRGPYRLVNHPNYVVVIAEIALLPLVFGLWRAALVFTLLNAALLAVRIREENRALSASSASMRR